MNGVIVEAGQKFAMLTVIRKVGISQHGKSLFSCLCDCGNETTVIGSHLRNGNTRSCGCLNFTDMTGRKVGRLTVISRAENQGCHAAWNCLCDCGKETVVRGVGLRNGNTKSCGCWNREVSTKHGHRRSQPGCDKKSPTYQTWQSVLTRCYNANCQAFRFYGGAGIQVSDRWNPAKGGSFKNFLADMGERPEETTLGRFLDTGNYEPGNVAWQTDAEQGAEKHKKHLMKASGTRQEVAA